VLIAIKTKQSHLFEQINNVLGKYADMYLTDPVAINKNEV
jgi:hypothetical protein